VEAKEPLLHQVLLLHMILWVLHQWMIRGVLHQVVLAWGLQEEDMTLQEEDMEDFQEEEMYGTDEDGQEEWATMIRGNTLNELFTGIYVNARIIPMLRTVKAPTVTAPVPTSAPTDQPNDSDGGGDGHGGGGWRCFIK